MRALGWALEAFGCVYFGGMLEMAPSLGAALMGPCWHISVGVSPRELPCDPQLLKGRDSECQNPNPKLLSARFLLTGLV